MAIDNITLIRKRIGDNKKTETESLALTPTTIAVQLQYNNAEIFSLHDKNQSSSILVENTDYTFDTETGVISLLYTPQDGSVLTATYYYYAFSQAELEDLQASYGTNGAVVEALRWLIADSARLHDYSRGATSESLSQIIKNLQSMLDDYQKNLNTIDDDTPTSNLTIKKRTNQFYRGTTDIPFDLSRDDSLSK